MVSENWNVNFVFMSILSTHSIEGRGLSQTVLFGCISFPGPAWSLIPSIFQIMGFIFILLAFYFFESQFQTKSNCLKAECQCLSFKELSAAAFVHGNSSPEEGRAIDPQSPKMLWKGSEATSQFFRAGSRRSEGLSGWPKIEITCRKSQAAESQLTLKLWPEGLLFLGQ